MKTMLIAMGTLRAEHLVCAIVSSTLLPVNAFNCCECIDRMHLNGFIPILQLPGHLVPATVCTSCIL